MKEIEIRKHSGLYTLKAEQQVNSTIDEVWTFFSNPNNLSEITPKHMNFKITSGKVGKMYAGQIITYKVNVLPAIKSNWTTEISQVSEKEYFIDNQLFGPYKLWHHQHHFEENESGVLMTDIVTYKLPFGIFGNIVSGFIKKKLYEIFSYRKQVIEERFI